MRDERLPSGITFHLTPEAVWQAQRGRDAYYPESFAREQYTHCTDGEGRAIAAGNRYYRDDQRPYLLLDVDLAQVVAPVRCEDDARVYPHVYGPIERGSVVRVRRLERGADGSFLAIGGDLEPRYE